MFSQILTPFTSNFRWHGDLWKAQNNFEEFTPFVKGVVTQFAKTTLLFILACIAIEVGAATLKGKVIGISDGDTVDVLDSCRIPDDCIDSKRYPLFMARDVMRVLIERLQAEGATPS